jgi:hypothetical protein
MQVVITRSASESISAVPLGHGTRSRSYRHGRICSAAGCSTVLSVYNPSALCSVHGSRHSAHL